HTNSKISVRGCNIGLLRGGSGRPLLILHGAGGAGVWLPFMTELAARHDVIVAEHPGFGASDTPEWLDTLADLAPFSWDVLARLDFDGVDLVGSRIAGWIAAELAVRNPARLISLTLVGAAGLTLPGVQRVDMFLASPEQRIRDLFHDPKLAEPMLN